MSAGFPSATNVFISSTEATGGLQVEFSRNPKDFKLNSWAAIRQVKKGVGQYIRLGIDQAARIEGLDLNEFRWADGQDAPTGDWGLESFEFKPYMTERYFYGFRIGDKTREQAAWEIVQQHARGAAQRAMTARTFLAARKATDTAQYDSSHYATATTWGGGAFDAGTETAPYLKKAILAMADKIFKDTNGSVKIKELMVVMNETTARKIAASQEIHSYLARSQFSLSVLRGDPNVNEQWGLPGKLYGFDLVIEDAQVVTSKKGAASRTTAPCWPDGTVAMMARPGSLVSEAGGPNFSTVQLFVYEEMSVETMNDVNNRRVDGRVVDDFGVEVVAPVAGCLATSSVS